MLQDSCLGYEYSSWKNSLYLQSHKLNSDGQQLALNNWVRCQMHVVLHLGDKQFDELNEWIAQITQFGLQQQKIQFWEFDSSEGGLLDLENRINDTFNCIMIIFEQFDVSLFKRRIVQVQKICNENKMTGKVPIHLIGNDRLDMKISGKEKEIQRMIQTIYDGNRVFVHIVDFTQIKELNNLLQFVFKEK